MPSGWPSPQTNVGPVVAPIARRVEQGERRRVDHADHQCAVARRPSRHLVHPFDQAKEIRLLDDHGRWRRPGGQGVEIRATIGGDQRLADLDALVTADRPRRIEVQGVAGTRHGDVYRRGLAGGARSLPSTACAYGHQYGLAQGRAAVVDRGVGDIHAGQRRHHRLVFVDDLQRPLAGFGLVGRVRRHELAAAGDIPHSRRDVVVVAPGAGEARACLVLSRALGHRGEHGHFPDPLGQRAEVGARQFRVDLVE